MANTSIFDAFERFWQHVIFVIGDKAEATHNHDDEYTSPEQVHQAIENYMIEHPVSGGISSGEPDLVIGLNVANTKTYEDGSTGCNRWLKNMKAEDVSVISGDIVATAEKVKQDIPVRIILKAIHFYGNDLWYKSLAEAIHVSCVNRGYYPSGVLENLNIVFFLSDTDVYNEPVIMAIDFDSANGDVYNFSVQNMMVIDA